MRRSLLAAAILPGLVVGCGAAEPVVGHFVRRIDQLDRARWENVCGASSEYVDQPVAGGPRETTLKFSNAVWPPPEPELRWNCMASRDTDAPEIRNLRITVRVMKSRRLLEAQPIGLSLLRDLVPEHVWPYVLVVASGPRGAMLSRNGFTMTGGYVTIDRELHGWDFEIWVDRPPRHADRR